MLKSLIILFFFVLGLHAYYYLRRLLYFLQMLQLNSYYSGRYLKWIWRNKKVVFSLKEFLPFLAIASFMLHSLFLRLLILGFIYLELWLRFPVLNEKKPLVFTARILRLLSFSLLCLGAIYISLIYISWKFGKIGVGYTIFILANLTIWSPMILWLINSLVMPLEKMIQYWYVRDAKRYLDKMPNLESIGITGSFGKTTTKYFLQELLKERFYTLKTPERYNTLMGVTKVIRSKLRLAHEKFVVEMSAKQPGDIEKICKLVRPKFGLVTVIGEQHLETFKSLERIQYTKGELIRALPANGIAFLNIDDQNSRILYQQAKCRVITFGFDKQADFAITNYQISISGSDFTLKVGDNLYNFTTSLLGKANLCDLLGSISVAVTLGVDIKLMKNVIKNLKAPPHRLDMKKVAPEVWFLDDAFNANPVGVTNALSVLGQFSNLRKIIVTPGMVELGSKEDQYNFEFGCLISEVVDYVILVGKKQTKAIYRGMQEKQFNFDHCFIAASFKEARQHLENMLRPKDIVLFENDLPDTYLEG